MRNQGRCAVRTSYLKWLLMRSDYVDFDDQAIMELAEQLGGADAVGYARSAFEYVRDRIPHTAQTDRQVVTARASQVLAEGTGICHAKANLLAALIRARGDPGRPTNPPDDAAVVLPVRKGI